MAAAPSNLVEGGVSTAGPPGRSRSPMSRIFDRALSFPVAAAFVLALLTFVIGRSRFDDRDTWWHLKVGESIWSTHALPHSDQYSYTTHAHAWIPHEWLAEVSMAGAYNAGGNRGLLLWLCALGSLTFLLTYALCSLCAASARIGLLGGLAALFFGTVGLAIRPLVLGYVFLAAELLFIYLARTRNRRWLWALPPLFAVWVNCHGSFLFGLVVLGVFVCGSLLAQPLGRIVPDDWARQERRLLCAVFAVSAVALLANPVGPRLAAYPFDLLLKQKDNLAMAPEWAALNVQDPRGAALCGLGGLLLLLFLVRRPPLRADEALLLALGFGTAILHVRMLFGFGILVAPVLCRLLADAWGRQGAPARSNRSVNAMIILGCVAVMILSFPTSAQIERQIRRAEPVEAVDFIRRTGLAGPMLNDYKWGGYLIWALPEQKVFIDSRMDVFDWTGVLGDYRRWAAMAEDPQRLLD
ncbi:MAG TPA: hypothetical protein VEU62_03890, partial [Bryobacterales bacterium]|nr:hypothetical protein [Bryobacterales bacterium]